MWRIRQLRQPDVGVFREIQALLSLRLRVSNSENREPDILPAGNFCKLSGVVSELRLPMIAIAGSGARVDRGHFAEFIQTPGFDHAR